MSVRVLSGSQPAAPTPERDYLHVRVCASPDDDTVTLATIQRFVDSGGSVDETGTTWKVRTLVADQPMSPEDAMGFAKRYAERKKISLVVADREND